MQLVERHGVVTREAVLAEGVVGGFASVYGVLKVLEDRGQVRAATCQPGAAQFALPGAVDRLRRYAARTIRHSPQFRVTRCEGTDDGGPVGDRPAQPYGGTLPWPESPAVRRIGAASSSFCATAFRWCGTTGAPITS